MAERFIPDSYSKAFLAGKYVVTRAQAITLSRWYYAGTCLYQLKQLCHPGVSFQELAVAIRVGSRLDRDSYNIDDLYEMDKTLFDPDTVILGLGQVGEAHQNND